MPTPFHAVEREQFKQARYTRGWTRGGGKVSKSSYAPAGVKTILYKYKHYFHTNPAFSNQWVLVGWGQDQMDNKHEKQNVTQIFKEMYDKKFVLYSDKIKFITPVE